MFSAVSWASGAVFMFCATRLIFGGTKGIGSRFHVLRSRAHFRRYGGRQVPISCFALPASFSPVPRASGLVFMFCAPELLFDDIHGRRVPFSYFALPYSFSVVTRASGPIFLFCAPGLVFDDIQGDAGIVYMFCAPGLIFGGTKGVGSCFHVLRSMTRFRRRRVRRFPISCFARPDSFSAVPRESGPIFMFCTSGLVFDDIQGRRVPFTCFALHDSFFTVASASVPVLMFYAY
jgi:hypothetical protein